MSLKFTTQEMFSTMEGEFHEFTSVLFSKWKKQIEDQYQHKLYTELQKLQVQIDDYKSALNMNTQELHKSKETNDKLLEENNFLRIKTGESSKIIADFYGQLSHSNTAIRE